MLSAAVPSGGRYSRKEKKEKNNMAFEEILALMPPFARFLYYFGAVGFSALAACGFMMLIRLIDPPPADWWNEDGD